MGVLVLLAVLGVVRVGLGGSDLSVRVCVCACVQVSMVMDCVNESVSHHLGVRGLVSCGVSLTLAAGGFGGFGGGRP